MTCTADRINPASLKIEVDQRFFHASLDHAAAVATRA
jgi:hypothetical protein